jgi:diaminopimelate decarboxylase/diaminopimelate epimerase
MHCALVRDGLQNGDVSALAEKVITRRLALFPDTTQIKTSPTGEHLTIAGCDLTALVDQYNTPLYLYDRATLDAAATTYRAALSAFYPGESEITYAGKAFLCTAIVQWAGQKGLWVDCSSLGELKIAEVAGASKKHIVVHGVNKSPADLATAVDHAGTIVVDNLTELERLVPLWRQERPPFPNVWLRLRPGVAVDTHTYTQTGQTESKFGMNGEEILYAARFCRKHHLPLKGLHFHLGSQLRDPAPVAAGLDKALDLLAAVGAEDDWTLCPGGGLGVAYHEDDLPQPEIDSYVRYIAESLVTGCQRRGLPLPRLHLEPGRSLIARAGVALYRVGAVKQSGERRWLLLDGGMADNPRPALYGARYSALPIWQPGLAATGLAWLAGPYCESGDILIEGLALPPIQPGEIIAIPVGGAYQLSMSNNYNGARRPAVLWLEDGKSHLIQARERPEDLARRDRKLRRSAAEATPGTERQQMPRLPGNVRFVKYHALGNDYLVLNPSDVPDALAPSQIRLICNRHYGVGSDGILLGPFEDLECRFGLKFFNPDGSEFEKSGNGLRIFSRYLWDEGWVREKPFTIATPGGKVMCCVHQGGRQVTVEMGVVSFDSRRIPVDGPPREVLDEVLLIDGQELRYCAATTGNPHCVVVCDQTSAQDAQRLGPLIEKAPRFPKRTNVQFMQVLDRGNVQIEIWERGAGYTLASGSSSCAAAAVAYRLGLCDAQIAVHMPGGQLDISISEDFAASMTGPVSKVCQGVLALEMFGEAESVD